MSIDGLIKSCYRGGGRPAALLAGAPRCVRVNKVMCSLSRELLLRDGRVTGGILIVGPNASQCDEEKPGRGETLSFACFPTELKKNKKKTCRWAELLHFPPSFSFFFCNTDKQQKRT